MMTARKKPIFIGGYHDFMNARDLSASQIVDSFIPTEAFWRLLNSKNQIVLGARGSGKTVVMKMLRHDAMSQCQIPELRRIVDRRDLVGIYLATSVDWVGALSRDNQTPDERRESEKQFVWKLNLATCSAFLGTVRSCLNYYYRNKLERVDVEAALVEALAVAWEADATKMRSVEDLREHLRLVEFRAQVEREQFKINHPSEAFFHGGTGAAFATSLFSPLRYGIHVASRLFNFPPTTSWLLAIDEAEFLRPEHVRILNTYMRSDSGNLRFKIATLPYQNDGLETNLERPLDVGHDFEYLYIDRLHSQLTTRGGGGTEEFTERIFRNVLRAYELDESTTLDALLGPSPLLERRSWDHRDQGMMQLFRTYASDKTLDRASRILREQSDSQFRDQIARKMTGALLLRDAVSNRKPGRSEVELYSGKSLLVRCSDANPRRLLTILNRVLFEAGWTGQRGRHSTPLRALTPSQQARLLRENAESVVSQTKSDMHIGEELCAFIDEIGKFMQRELYQKRLTTDQTSAISVRPGASEAHWQLVKRAVQLGLLFPNVSQSSADAMPQHTGVFQLAYVLAPHYLILPRRGKSRDIEAVMDERFEFVDTSTRVDGQGD